MGGGDLNLKKSWHPHTMKNQEKVWKAEQAKSQEEKKLNDLRREIEEEKNREELKRVGRESGVLTSCNESDKKLDWMYKSSTELINREEYLLGRKIDKSFESLQAEEKEQQNLVGVKQPLNHVEHECVPFSIRSYKNLENSEQVDLQRKVMEDPLMLIKQREIESRRKILENPVKLKELHRILKADEKLRKVSKKSKKGKKSKKKHKKRTKSSSSGTSDCNTDSDLDTKLAAKLKGGLLNKNEVSSLGLNLTKLLDSKFEKISLELDKAAGKGKKRLKNNRSISDDLNTDSSDQGRYSRSRSLSADHRFEKESRKSQRFSRDKGRSNKYESKRYKSSSTKNFINGRRDRIISRTRDQNRRSSRSVSTDKQKCIKYGRRSRTRSRDRNISNSKQLTSTTKYQNSNKSSGRSRSKSLEHQKSYRARSKSPPLTFSQKQYNSQKNEKPRYSPIERSSKLIDEEKQAKLMKKRDRSISRTRDQNRRSSRSISTDKKQKRIKYGRRSRTRSRDSTIRNSKDINSKSNGRSRSKSLQHQRSYRGRSKSPPHTFSQTQYNYSQKNEKPRQSTIQRSSKLTDVEKQAKLMEMMSNAAWREEERTEVVRKHRESYAREEESHRSREFDKDFLNKEVKKAMANQTSVGTRLRANVNNIQRSSAAMNSNFARK